MSLVNKMLKDLESRKNKPEPGEDIPAGLQSVEEPEAKVSSLKYLIYFIVVVVVCVGLVIGWQYYKSPKKTAEVAKKSVVAKPNVIVDLNKDKAPATAESPKTADLKEQPAAPAEPEHLPVTHAIHKSLTQSEHDVPRLLSAPAKPKADVDVKTPAEDDIKKPVKVELTPAQMRDQDYTSAVGEIEAGHADKGMSALKTILDKTPSYTPARKTLAAMMASSNPEAAIKLIDQGLALDNKDVSLLIAKAQLQIKQDDLKGANATLETVSPSIKQYPTYYELRAGIAQRLGQYQFAAQFYRQLITATPHVGKYWLGIGVAFESMGKVNAARRSFQQAISTQNLSPNMEVFAESRLGSLGGG